MKSKLIIGASALVALSGCSLVQDNSPSVRSAQALDMSSYFAQRVAEGRSHLDANRPAQAVEAFRQASYDERYAPQAFNGMGVAYVMMGREDTARRMFERAVEADPTDERFVRNLARLDVPSESYTREQPLMAQAEETQDADTINAASLREEHSAELEEGRRLLGAARPVLAIEAFRRAAEDERFAAQAYNGMGVAYSSLGNEEVARHMFERAIELAPADRRFVRNLARLEGSSHSAQQRPALALATEAAEPQSPSARVTSSGDLLEQTAREVRVEVSDNDPGRERRITYISAAVIQPIHNGEQTLLGQSEKSPNSQQAVELFAAARRQNVSFDQDRFSSTQNVTYLMRPAIAWLGSGTAEKIEENQDALARPALDEDTLLAMNFRQAWLESGSLESL